MNIAKRKQWQTFLNWSVFSLIALASVTESRAEDASSTPSVSQFQDTITSLVLPFLPHEYKNEKQWGQTTQVFDGLKVEMHGLKIETRRRWKTVNHGTWKRYEAQLVDPKNNLHLKVENYRESAQGLQFDLDCDAKLHLFGRLSQWNRGVQLISISADGNAHVRLRIGCQLSLQLDPSKFPPDILLRPTVTDAQLQLVDFRLNRVSDLHGPLVKQLGEGLEEIFQDKVQEENQKLPAKINKSLDKQKDKLRLSFNDLLKTPWGDLTRFAKPQP